MNGWDVALIAGVSAMGTAVAYVRNPEHKAFVLMLPIPFTLATLALGRTVDATNVLGLVLLLGFTLGVWALHVRLRWPILLAIAICAVAYCAIGAAVTALNLDNDQAFWGAIIPVFLVAAILTRALPYRPEPHHRTPLPVWVKLPTIALIIATIVGIKHHLGGFMTTFPMVGVVAAYEARYSLWTIVRRIPWVMVMLAPAMVVIRTTEPHVGLPVSLSLAWVLLLSMLWAFRTGYSGGAPAETQAAVPEALGDGVPRK